MSERTIVGSATPLDLNSGHLTNTVNVVETIDELNEEIDSTKLKFPELDEVGVRDLIITKLLLRTKELEQPDIFWCKDNPEDGMDCAEELISQFIDEDSEGQVIELEVAARLPNIKVKILPCNEHGGVELEYL